MTRFDGKVVVVTGAGRGIGREHARLSAEHGAHVGVNDLGGATDGSGSDVSAAQAVVDEITGAGGVAIANHDNLASWDGAQALIRSAIDTFGDLDIVVNNAGILRDRTLVNISEAEFDAVVQVHLKGTFSVTRWAAEYWRDRAKAGESRPRRIVNTTSGSGLFGNPGQANYAAAKMGVIGLTFVSALELERYGVRTNAIGPCARTRMTDGAGHLAAPDSPDDFDRFDPANISPLVLLLASEECSFNGQVFEIIGGRVSLYETWPVLRSVHEDRRWTVDQLLAATKDWPVGPPKMPSL